MPPRVATDVSRAILAGLSAAAVLGLWLGWLAPRLGLGKLDSPHLLGTYLLGGFGFPEGKLVVLCGWLLFALGGIVWALIYASYICDRLLGPGWLQGLTYAGVGVFLVTSLLILPVIGLVHPLVRAGRMPAPGLLGLGLSGGRVVLANFLGHCLFILGILYRRRLVFSSS